MTPETVAKARALLDSGAIEENVAQDVPSVWIQVEVMGEGRSALCRISGKHDRVELVEADGKILQQAAPLEESGPGDSAEMYEELKAMNFADLWRMAGEISPEAENFLLEGANMNMGVADKGMKSLWGMGVGRSDGNESNILDRIRHATGGASDVRMSGETSPS